MDSKIIDKVLSKTATPEEARRVGAWFATEDGQEYFSQRYNRESYLLNEKTIQEWSDYEVPTERMKVRFLSHLKHKVRTFRFRFVAAVMIPFFLLLGTFAFITKRTGIFSSGEMVEVVVPYGEQTNVVFQDGTKVQLNSGSKLQYPKSFGVFNRKVKLVGEGYFSVAKESARPFQVNLNEIDVTVTGTKFNAKAYPDETKISVSLEEGSVNITDRKNNLYALKAGQNADFDKETGICTIRKIEDMTIHTAWKSKGLDFYRTPLKDILKTLERQYGIKFEVKDSTLLNYRFSMSTRKINLKEVLDDLEKVSKIQFELNNQGKCTITTLK